MRLPAGYVILEREGGYVLQLPSGRLMLVRPGVVQRWSTRQGAFRAALRHYLKQSRTST
jgi:uncharacterized cupin superfamily protein